MTRGRDEGRGRRPGTVRPDLVRADRLRLLAAVDVGHGDSAVLLHALLHVTAELGGYGGMAHVYAGGPEHLRMVTSNGLPYAFTREWAGIALRGSAAPVRAVRENAFVYLPAAGVPEQRFGRVPELYEPVPVPEGAGMAAAPLPGPDGRLLGALSVLLPASRAPNPRQRAFCAEVARWAGGLLRLTPLGPEGVSPNLLGPPGPQEEAPRPAGPVAAPNWVWDVRTGEVVLDRSVLEDLGVDPAAFDGTIESWTDLIHPDDLPWVAGETDRAIRTAGRLDLANRLRRADGSYAWAQFQGQIVVDEHGEPLRSEGRMWNASKTHEALESVGRALLHMSDGLVSTTGDGRVVFVNAAAERLLDPAREMIGRPLWEVPALRDVPEVAQRCRPALAGRKPVDFEVPGPGRDQWYNLRLVPVPGGLTAYVTDVTERRRREAEHRAAERAAADRAALVSGLTRALAEAVTARDVVDAVAASVLPPFGATGLIVAVLEKERLNVVGSAGYPDAFVRRVHGTPLADAITRDALRTRTPEFAESPEELVSRHPQAAELIPGGKQAAAFLPLIASGHMVGVCVIAYDGPHAFTEDERTLLTALSGLVAQALERAGLYDAATGRARDLQRALLPRALPSLPALTAAARYLPSTRGSEVGGDWYDVIPLSADRVAVVIGDVMGHGMPEAATMGRLRTAVRTLSDLELPPDEVLARVNDLVGELGEEAFTTCLYGVYDPTTRVLAYADAGHLPPAVALPDGSVSFPRLDPDPPLGVADPPFETHEVALPDGSVLALYTDGLVEVPGGDIEDGMGRLTRTLATALHGEGGDGDGRAVRPEELCDTVTAALLPADRPAPDDTALLVVRTRALPADAVASWPLPDDPVAASQARKYTREQLAAWHLEDLETTTELIVSELVGNVVRHARGPVALRLLRSRTLICEVSDGSLTTPHIRHPSALDESGRGLQLVAAMAARWGTRYTATGKSIWTEQPIAQRGDGRGLPAE
ncbi:SpoIIE family protein phosphatase [Streptomyces sp. B1866]|uniref:SpoIIE family protein phosphatase n=1 Tax=Streptomyces sp. B1866 TaxID=3075431 RepID=UPI0028928F67|nr:SpoIIE family protein phosphatase [Streptomyces sp. B1866]MDT3395057.1 SpoIIE family protein phosphatase [Streptomyces sp. B1866]